MLKLLSGRAANAAGKAVLLSACIASSGGDAALAKPGNDGAVPPAGSALPDKTPPKEELYLEVYINDYTTNTLTRFRRYKGGCFAIDADDLKVHKLKVPESAFRGGGEVCLERIPGMTYRYEAQKQTIHLNVPDGLRELLSYDARKRTSDVTQTEQGADFSAIFNYALNANFGADDYNRNFDPSYQGFGAFIDARFFSAYGNFEQSLSARAGADTADPTVLRLVSRLSYNDDMTLRTYSAGDVISGSLSWTRSMFIGGIQITRDFALRPDLVTQPLPTFSGSAAVPSTVEVYAGQSRAFTQQIQGGPFTISNLPVVSGPGVLKLVVRDPSGKETTTDYAYYASSRLLASGIIDYSIEAGFARTFFGVESNSYDPNPVASGSLRYGFTDRLTVETHVEGGAGLANGGAGAVFGLGTYGVATVAASGSSYADRFGGQFSGSVETALWDARLYARSLRSVGDYEDLASVTAPRRSSGFKVASQSGATYLRHDQLSLSMPLPYDVGSFSMTYTDAKDADNIAYKVGSLSYSRPFLKGGTFFANVFNDFDRSNSWGVFAGLNFSWDKYSAGTTIQDSASNTVAGGYFSRTLSQEAGSYGYSIQAQDGNQTNNSISGAYRANAMTVQGNVRQTNKQVQGSVSAEGAVAVMNGVYFANRIDNSFAVVEAGIPGVTVLQDNNPVGQTDANGRIVIPNIRAREENSVTIDPASLPIQADMEVTQQTVVPKLRGGTTIRFKGEAQPASASAVFKDEKGAVLPTGSEVWVNGAAAPAVIGYDGETYLTKLAASNTALAKRPDGTACNAVFDFAPQQGAQARIDSVVCTANAPVSMASVTENPGITVKAKQ